MKTDFKKFSDEVKKMRLAQGRYFELIGKAKKTKDPDDFKAAKNVLAISKDLEKQVDTMLDQLDKHGELVEQNVSGTQANIY